MCTCGFDPDVKAKPSLSRRVETLTRRCDGRVDLGLTGLARQVRHKRQDGQKKSREKNGECDERGRGSIDGIDIGDQLNKKKCRGELVDMYHSGYRWVACAELPEERN